MFIVALITIIRTWKQPKCPLIEEWIEKMWYVSHTHTPPSTNARLVAGAVKGTNFQKVTE